MDGNLVVRKIEQILAQNGLSKADFYAKSGISSATLSQWRHGVHNPSETQIKKAAAALGVPVSALTGEKDSPSTEADGPIPPKEYAGLTPEQREIVDGLIRSLAAQNPK